MKRTRWNDTRLAPIVSDFLRVGMWPISETIKPASETIDSITGIPRRIYLIGKNKTAGYIAVEGKLCEYDRGTFLTIRALDKENRYEGIRGKMSDLVKPKDVKNPYQSSSINPVWDSVNRLMSVHVSISPKRRGGRTATAFKLVSGNVYPDGRFFLTTHDYMKTIEDLSLYEINIPVEDYCSIKSPITRSLKYFLFTQKYLSTKGYSISLSKLCKRIGYKRNGRPLWQIWPHIERAMEELKQTGFLDNRSHRVKNKLTNEGGIIRFWSIKRHSEQHDTKHTSDNSVPNSAKYPKYKFDGEIRYTLDKDGVYRDNQGIPYGYD
jgi:hypothetical protein